MSDLYGQAYNPDVLSCLANLSNDEVFTPPEVANQMLDLLPEEIWYDTEATFLDPACKSGVFLREIAKRLIDAQMPDYLKKTEIITKKKKKNEELTDEELQYLDELDSVVSHVLKNQVFGIATTELCSYLSRRSTYCTKYPTSVYSIVRFDDDEPQGNIRYEQCEHVWVRGKCRFCHASQEQYERGEEYESYAYEFIHWDNPEEKIPMRFDVVIGNPPYQLSDGGNNASAIPIYNSFVEQAIKLNPRYLSMIIPSRWYCGGRGLEGFRKSMLSDKRIVQLHDFKSSADCFPGIRNGGGICYFLWDRDNPQENAVISEHDSKGIYKVTERPLNEFGNTVFIRDAIVCEVVRKVTNSSGFAALSETVYPQKPFGLRTNFIDFKDSGEIKLYTKKARQGYAYIDRTDVSNNVNLISKWKVVTSRSTSVPEEDNGQVLRIAQTFIVEPDAVVTESYILIKAFEKESDAILFMKYLKTKFFRFLCQPTIVSPDVSKRTFIFVPDLNIDDSISDSFLYAKYKLTDEEIQKIESTIKEVD